MAAPQRALHREAGHPRHQRRRPRRRHRPDQGGRRPHPGRSRDHRLRAHPAGAPRHRRGQRTARPRRAHPGLHAQRDGGARHPGARLHPAAATGRAGCGQRQSRGLHQPRPDHHPAQGPVRRRDPHPLPPRPRRRGRRHRPGGASDRGGAGLPAADHRSLHPPAARVAFGGPALRGFGPVRDRRRRDCRGIGPAPRRCPGRDRTGGPGGRSGHGDRRAARQAGIRVR